MKTSHNQIAALFAALITFGSFAGEANAAIVFFEAKWEQDASIGFAQAIAVIGIDTAMIPNPGVYNDAGIPTWFDSISIKVSGASSGNGTFDLDDFSSVVWGAGQGTLDLTTELVSQASGGVIWGPKGSLFTGGQFNLFRSADQAQAPTGVGFFTLGTAGGESMELVTFAPVPEPSSLALLGFGLLSSTFRRLRR